jgi:hypothetical protein
MPVALRRTPGHGLVDVVRESPGALTGGAGVRMEAATSAKDSVR